MINELAVHEVGEFEMKGLDAPVRVSRVAPVGVDPEAFAARFEVDGRISPVPPRSRRGSTPPRRSSDASARCTVRWAWRRARRGEGSALLILGPPGIGKTRLLAELAVSAARDGARISSTTFGEGVDPVDPADVDAGDAPTLVVLDDVDPSPDAIEDLERLSARVPGPTRSSSRRSTTRRFRPSSGDSLTVGRTT